MSGRPSFEHQELIADSARLVHGAVNDFKEGQEGEAADQSSVLKDVTGAFKSKKGDGYGFNEALGVSNLGVRALGSKDGTEAHLDSLGSDRTGIAHETLGEKMTKPRGSKERRKSGEGAPKVTKMKKNLVREAMKDLIAKPDDGPELTKNAKMKGDRCIVTVGEEERPIRMDTREGWAPKLNVLVQDIKRTRIHAHNREYNRVEKVRSLNQEIKSLTYKRAEYSLAVENWASDSWRWVNANRARSNPQEMLQDCAPAKRLGALRNIEKQCMVAVATGAKPPSPRRHPPAIRAWV